MKRILSVSIGSSVRDKRVEIDLMGEIYVIERIGTNGDMKKAIDIIRQNDGIADAFGIGGIDLYLGGGMNKPYVIRDAIPFFKAANATPIFDGTGVKKTIEKSTVKYLKERNIIDFNNKKVLVTCAIDRLKLAETLEQSNCELILGDLLFGLGLPIPIRSIIALKRIAGIAMPLLSRLPFKLLYPIGDKGEKTDPYKYCKYYQWADIITGDFIYLKKYMPVDMSGKVIITNTVTEEDVEMLKSRGVSMLVTTSPDFQGRSFGSNVIEAILACYGNKKTNEMKDDEYYEFFSKLNFRPRIEYF